VRRLAKLQSPHCTKQNFDPIYRPEKSQLKITLILVYAKNHKSENLNQGTVQLFTPTNIVRSYHFAWPECKCFKLRIHTLVNYIIIYIFDIFFRVQTLKFSFKKLHVAWAMFAFFNTCHYIVIIPIYQD
jgi:hypothetical protein